MVEQETMNFINLPSRGRRLVKVPALKLSGPPFYVGFEENLEATVAAIPFQKDEFSLILVLPGKPSDYIAGGLAKIESKLNNQTWSLLMKSLQLVPDIELQFPILNQRYEIVEHSSPLTCQNTKKMPKSDTIYAYVFCEKGM